MVELIYPAPTIETFKETEPNSPHLFNADRRALHDKIIQKFFHEAEVQRNMVLKGLEAEARTAARKQQAKGLIAEAPAVNDSELKLGSKDDPVLIMLAGGPGSGKSTLTKWLKNKGVLEGAFVALTLGSFQDLPEFGEIAEKLKHPHPEKSPTLNAEFYHLRRLIFHECVKRGFSMTVDDHLDDPVQDARLMHEASQAKYLRIGVGMTIAPYAYFMMLIS